MQGLMPSLWGRRKSDVSATAPPPNHPLIVFWRTINAEVTSANEALAIICNPNGGLECRSTAEMGLMKGITLSLNSRQGGATPLILATLAGRVDVMMGLLELGANIDAKESDFGYSPLHVAAYQGNVEALRVLISKGAVISAKDKKGWTPFHLAITRNSAEVVEFFMSREGFTAVDLMVDTCFTPLCLAVESKLVSMAHLLLANGASVGTGMDRRMTPLHLASQLGDVIAVLDILAAGANVHAADELGLTPLHYAARNKNNAADVIHLLMAEGAELSYRSKNGQTASDLASNGHHYHAIRAFEKFNQH